MSRQNMKQRIDVNAVFAREFGRRSAGVEFFGDRDDLRFGVAPFPHVDLLAALLDRESTIVLGLVSGAQAHRTPESWVRIP